MKVLIYTMDNCGYCSAAKTLLKTKNLDFQEINISNDEEKKFSLIKKTNHRTLPQIFIDDMFIGGYTELKAYLEDKK